MRTESRRKIASARAAAGKPQDAIEMRANIFLRTTGMRDLDKRPDQLPFLIGKFITTGFSCLSLLSALVLPLVRVFFLSVSLFLTFQIHSQRNPYRGNIMVKSHKIVSIISNR